MFGVSWKQIRDRQADVGLVDKKYEMKRHVWG